MEVLGWKPLDLVVGGMLTAGVALGVYKFGRLSKKHAGGAEFEAVSTPEMDVSNLQECIALARRSSELEISVPPKVGF